MRKSRSAARSWATTSLSREWNAISYVFMPCSISTTTTLSLLFPSRLDVRAISAQRHQLTSRLAARLISASLSLRERADLIDEESEGVGVGRRMVQGSHAYMGGRNGQEHVLWMQLEQRRRQP